MPVLPKIPKPASPPAVLESLLHQYRVRSLAVQVAMDNYAVTLDQLRREVAAAGFPRGNGSLRAVELTLNPKPRTVSVKTVYHSHGELYLTEQNELYVVLHVGANGRPTAPQSKVLAKLARQLGFLTQ